MTKKIAYKYSQLFVFPFILLIAFSTLIACQKRNTAPIPQGRVSGGGGFYFLVHRVSAESALNPNSASILKDPRLADRYFMERRASRGLGTIENLGYVINYGNTASRQSAIRIALNKASEATERPFLGDRLAEKINYLKFNFTDKPSPLKPRDVIGEIPNAEFFPLSANLDSDFLDLMNTAGMLAFQDFQTSEVEVYAEYKQLQPFDRDLLPFHEAYVASEDWDSTKISSYQSLGFLLAAQTPTLVDALFSEAVSELGAYASSHEREGMMMMISSDIPVDSSTVYRDFYKAEFNRRQNQQPVSDGE